MRTVAPRSRPDTGGADAGPDVDAVTAEGGVEGRRAAGMVVGVDPLVRRHEDGRHAVAGIDLGHLDAGRTSPQDDEAPRQLTGGGRLAVRPGPDLVEALDVVGDRRVRADRDDDPLRAEDADPIRGPCDDAAGSIDPTVAADDNRPGRLQVVDVPAGGG